ncbi:MAG: glycosyltransferase family 87 protein [Bacteroidota bacterium]|nr:glycosyltransferase family 87 protein [Bacteroidota bacterium]MDP4234698.1 glycosyltransferase family 87 protein [Bacteroidota bacterium]MDP4243922.1 glycosyltransferase family 87 protein [Bacteroidota bacterium]MDP4288856.1 glycosyltransferase family 87 protein [Bacteroidota bacterium]
MINALEWIRVRLFGSARAIAVIVSLAFVVFFLVVAIWHLQYPYEIEWYEGLMMDHIMRVVNGLPIYAAPDLYFSAALYQPLYYYVVAPLIHWTGPAFLAGRIVTVASTVLTAMVILFTVSRLTHRSKFAMCVAAGLFFSTYNLTELVQTVVRVDSLYVLFIITAFYAISQRRMLTSILAGVLLAAAYFTKQEAIFFYPLPFLWLFLIHRHQAVISVAVLVGLIAVGTLLLQSSSHGWYSYYVYGMPRAKGQYYGYMRVIAAFPTEILRYWGVAALILGMFIGLVRGKAFSLKSPEGFWALAVLSAVLQLCAHRGDQMSGNNVLHPLSAMLAVFIPYAVWRTSQERHSLARVFEWGLVIQLVVFIVDPRWQPMLLPGASERTRADHFVAYLHSLPGDVVIPAHGFLGPMAGKQTHTHCQVEDDVLVMRDSISRHYQDGWRDALVNRKFAAYIWDDGGSPRPDSIPGYTYAGMLPDSLRIGCKMGPRIIRPTFLYLPVGSAMPKYRSE